MLEEFVLLPEPLLGPIRRDKEIHDPFLDVPTVVAELLNPLLHPDSLILHGEPITIQLTHQHTD